MSPLSRIRTPQYLPKNAGKKGKQTRIRIPQPAERPLRLSTRDVVRWAEIQSSPWWYILHRRGIKRPSIGEDQREARAVPKDQVKGTLPERMVYKYLMVQMRFTPGIDFDFQSSSQGGRMELGGIVADFLFFYMKIVIQVDGPTHLDYLRRKKDVEQETALEEMGYRTFRVDEATIYNEYALEDWMRRTFGLAEGYGGGGGAFGSYATENGYENPISGSVEGSEFDMDEVYRLCCSLNDSVDRVVGRMNG
jgi:hypothetical protein